MTQANSIELRRKFLKEGAQLLALSAPASSAVLGTEHDKLLQVDDADLEVSTKDWSVLRRDVCGGCGSLMLPGWTCGVSYELSVTKTNKRRKRPKSKATTDRPEKAVVYICAKCNSKTAIGLPPRVPRPIKGVRVEASHEAFPAPENKISVEEDTNKNIMKTANASSKQRKKARKGGLQAMLDKSKTQKNTDGGLGLDLMDFMG